MVRYIYQHKIQENVTLEIRADSRKQAETFLSRSGLFTDPMDWDFVEEIAPFDNRDD